MQIPPLVRSLALVVGGASVAFSAGLATRQAFGLGPEATSAVIALAVTLLFAWRRVDGLQAFALVVLLADTVDYWTPADIRYIDELAIPGLMAVTLLSRGADLRRIRLTWREGALGLLLGAAVMSSIAHDIPYMDLVVGLALFFKGIAFFYVAYSVPVTAADLGRIQGVWLAVGGIIVLVGFAQFVGITGVSDALFLPTVTQQRGDIDVVNSVFTHPALFGWLTAFMSLFLYARFLVLREHWALALAILLNFGTVISGRRTPLVGVLAGLAVGAVRQITSARAALRVWAAMLAVVALGVVISIPIMGEFYLSTLREYGESPEAMAEVFTEDPDSLVISDLQPRSALYLGSLAVARDEFPLGAGIGQFGSHLSREQYSPLYARYGLDRIYGLAPANPMAVTDTFWPMILGETGIVGLVAMLTFVFLIGLQLWRAAAGAATPAVQAFNLGALMVYAETMVRSLTSSVFVAPPIAYFVLGASALALALHRTAREPSAVFEPSNTAPQAI